MGHDGNKAMIELWIQKEHKKPDDFWTLKKPKTKKTAKKRPQNVPKTSPLRLQKTSIASWKGSQNVTKKNTEKVTCFVKPGFGSKRVSHEGTHLNGRP